LSLSTAEVPKVENSTLLAPVKAEKEEQNPVENEANKVAAPQIIPSVNSDANSKKGTTSDQQLGNILNNTKKENSV
jgi:hypothetical protein